MTANPTEKLLPNSCPFCGRFPTIGLGKKQGCQLHGEPMQSVTISCSCDFHPSIHAGDIYNGGKYKAQQEAVLKWNTRTQKDPQALVCALRLILKTHDLTCKGEDCQISGIDLARDVLKEWEEK